MKTILHDIINTLTKALPEVYVLENWGQLSLEQPAVNFPACLVDFDSITFTPFKGNKQRANATINIELADIMPATRAKHCDDNLHILDLADAINDAMRSIYDERFTTPLRLSIQRVRRPDGVRHFVITFSTRFTTEAASE